MVKAETEDRENGQRSGLPNVNWKSLSSQQARLTYALLDYLPSEEILANDHVYASRSRLESIAELAKGLTEWNDLWGKVDYGAFQHRIEQGLYKLSDGIDNDDLLASSFSVLALEETCYQALGAITNTDLATVWREHIVKKDGEKPLQDWARINREEGLRVHPTAATGRDERIRAVQFPDSETFYDGLLVLDGVQGGNSLNLSIPGDNSVHVPRWFYKKWNGKLHAQQVPHTEFDPTRQSDQAAKIAIPEMIINEEKINNHDIAIRIVSGNLPFGLELMKDGTRTKAASADSIAEAYQELLSSIAVEYGKKSSEDALQMLTFVILQDEIEAGWTSRPFSVLSVRRTDQVSDESIENERKVPAVAIIIPDPLKLFNIAQRMNSLGPKTALKGVLEFTTLNDLVLKGEHTNLSGYNTRNDKKPDFSLRTELQLATARTAEADHGYYEDDKVFSIQDILGKLGYTSIYKKFYGQNSLTLLVDDIEVHVDFGYDSRESEVKEALSSLTEYDLGKVKNDIRNKNVSMELFSRDRTDYGRTERSALTTFDDFVEKLEKYKMAVQDVIGSLYAVEGVIPQAPSIIWKPFFDSPIDD